MADAKITALATGTALHSADWLVYVDTVDTSMAASGTDKKLSPAVLTAGLVPFVASGASHAQGVVPDPGASAGSTKFLREDSTWAVPAGGGGLSAIGNNQILANISGSSAVPIGDTLTGIIDSAISNVQGSLLYRDAAAWLALGPGTSGQILASQGAAANPHWITGGGTSPGGSTGQVQYNSAGSFGGDASLTIGAGGEVIYGAIADPTLTAGASWQNTTLAVESGVSAGLAFRKGGTVWSGKNGTAVANSTALTSIFSGVTTLDGSLTIPANKAVVGKIFRLCLAGTITTTAGTPTLTFQVLLGGVIVCQGTSAAMGAGGPNLWKITDSEFQIQTIGATGKIIGYATVGVAALATLQLGSTAANAAPAQATVDFTAGASWDIKVQWSAASASNSFQLLYGHIEVLS